MTAYFDPADSLKAVSDGSIPSALRSVADRYVGLNPVEPASLRVTSGAGFRRTKDCRYDLDAAAKIPGLRDGQYVYIRGALRVREAGDYSFAASSYGPVKIHVNGSRAFASDLDDEVFPDRKKIFSVRLEEGWNQFVLECAKTPTGCGAVFGSPHSKDPLHFLSPGAARSGQEGFVWSSPADSPLESIPASGDDSLWSSFAWYPATSWPEADSRLPNFSRVFSVVDESVSARGELWALSSLVSRSIEPVVAKLSGRHFGPCEIFVDGKKIFASPEAEGSVEATAFLAFGSHAVHVRSLPSSSPRGFSIDAAVSSPKAGSAPSPFAWALPAPVHGANGAWLYLGPFAKRPCPEGQCPDRFDEVYGPAGGETFWRADAPDASVRLFRESVLFGRWHYPLGVTLYGLHRTGVELADAHYTSYVERHMAECLRVHRYSFFDRDAFGAPGVSYQLALMDSLDDCGSFGSAMLESGGDSLQPVAREIADYIADYIENRQSRLPDGALYRADGIFDFMKDTMWCDDLYMSVPFLCRYFSLTGDAKYIDDAARQFILYRNYCFIPGLKIMSHVHDLKSGRATGVPWGRGNGWVLFSLTELLAVLPENHRDRPACLSFFRELCEGYLALQGANGLWHQVLTDPDSYEESSCTSMFVYSFARGVYNGWLPDASTFAAAAFRGWDGLVSRAVDRQGNVYGVCRGSGYSFSARYYKEDLLPRFNDTHGIGIVLLAGVETAHLSTWLKDKN